MHIENKFSIQIWSHDYNTFFFRIERSDKQSFQFKHVTVVPSIYFLAIELMRERHLTG